MTLNEFQAWLVQIDPKATRFYTPKAGICTVWAEYGRIPAYADGRNQGGWKVQIDRYTTDEDDGIANAIAQAIEESVLIACEHLIDYDMENGLIRHIFDCEVW